MTDPQERRPASPPPPYDHHPSKRSPLLQAHSRDRDDDSREPAAASDYQHLDHKNKHPPTTTEDKQSSSQIIPIYRRLLQRPHPNPHSAVEMSIRTTLLADENFWLADATRGTDYDISAPELRKLTDPKCRKYGFAFPAGTRKSEAYATLSTLQQKPRGEREITALSRLERAWDRPMEQTNPDLFIKIVKDLDTVCFASALDHRLLVTWSHIPTTTTAPSTSSSWCTLDKVHIQLARTMYLDGRKEVIWGMLLHEMLYAFVGVQTDLWWPGKARHTWRFFEAAGGCVRLLGGLEGLRREDVVVGEAVDRVWRNPVAEEEEEGGWVR